MRYAKHPMPLVLLLVLCGCYVSPTPLGRPGGVYADPALVGVWQCVPPPGDTSLNGASVRVVPFDESQHYAEWTEGDETVRYRVYGTLVGSHVLLNVSAVEAPRPEWIFVRYRIDSAGRMELAVVDDQAVKGLPEQEVPNAIRARIADEALYKVFASCTRQSGSKQ